MNKRASDFEDSVRQKLGILTQPFLFFMLLFIVLFTGFWGAIIYPRLYPKERFTEKLENMVFVIVFQISMWCVILSLFGAIGCNHFLWWVFLGLVPILSAIMIINCIIGKSKNTYHQRSPHGGPGT